MASHLLPGPSLQHKLSSPALAASDSSGARGAQLVWRRTADGPSLPLQSDGQPELLGTRAMAEPKTSSLRSARFYTKAFQAPTARRALPPLLFRHSCNGVALLSLFVRLAYNFAATPFYISTGCTPIGYFGINFLYYTTPWWVEKACQNMGAEALTCARLLCHWLHIREMSRCCRRVMSDLFSLQRPCLGQLPSRRTCPTRSSRRTSVTLKSTLAAVARNR